MRPMAQRQWQLGWRESLGYAVVAAAVTAAGWAAYSQVVAAREAGDRARQALLVLRQIAEVQNQLLNAETGQRGYLLTGEDAYLQPYEQSRASATAALAELKRLTANDPRQQERVGVVDALTTAKLDELRETVERQRTAGADAALALVRTHVGKGIMDRVRSLLDDMAKEETAALDRRSIERSVGFTLAGRVAVLGSGVALVAVALSTLALNRNVRRRAAVERTLRESEERLRVTLRSIGDAVIATDARGRVVFMNQAAQALVGWSEREALARPLDDVFQVVHEITRSRVESPVARVLREGAVVGLPSHSALLARGGGELPIDDSGAPIRDADGELMGVVLVFRDASERKRQAREQERLHQEAAARAEAERANRTKDEFLAILSHELRSPLQGILGWLTVLREMRSEPAQQRALQAIERGVRQQAQLVNDILDISRIVAGKLHLERKRVDLAAVVEECVDQAVPEAQERQQRLESEVADCGIVLGDRHRLRQSVTNLLANAVKFTPSGGRIEVSCRREGDAAVVTVCDDGEGIAPEFLPHIFDRFSQAGGDARRRGPTGGLGLGLSIVRQIVEVHGGTVGATSPGVGHGATFTIRLPLAPLTAGDGERDAPPPRPRGATLEGLSILLVDDDAETRESLALLLGLRGASVQHAGSVADALARCAEHPPDVVISDISMPDQDGYALVEALRRADAERRPLVVALTGFASASDRSRATGAGFDAHVSKPIDFDELVGTILGLAVARESRPEEHR
jgi:PAS domain S-box-containing protein